MFKRTVLRSLNIIRAQRNERRQQLLSHINSLHFFCFGYFIREANREQKLAPWIQWTINWTIIIINSDGSSTSFQYFSIKASLIHWCYKRNKKWVVKLGCISLNGFSFHNFIQLGTKQVFLLNLKPGTEKECTKVYYVCVCVLYTAYMSFDHSTYITKNNNNKKKLS